MKSTIRLSLFLLLLTQIVFGQTRTVQKDAFIQSRGKNNQDTVFSTNKSLYPPRLAFLKKNAIYEINRNKIKFYVFEKGMSVNQSLIAKLSGITPTKKKTFIESNDIYLDQDKFGIRVLRSGEFEYKTYVVQGKQIITFEAILDVIPKDAYYFDFPGKDTIPVKDCYDTTKVDGKKAFLTFQKKQTITENELVVEWLKPEETTEFQRIMKITNDKTLKPSWSFDLCYTQADKNRIEAGNKDQIFFYKLNNVKTVFRLKVRIGFGCPPKNNTKVNQLGGSIFIPSYAETFKQPNSTDVSVSPPN
jgi:hypothetical protein